MKRRLAAMVVALAATSALMAPAADAAPAPRAVAALTARRANFYPPGAQGSDWWYGINWDSTGGHTAVWARMSWSYMWTLNNSSDLSNVTAAGNALCGAIFFGNPPLLVTCIALVNLQFIYIRHEVYMGTHVYRQCLYYRFPAPPLVGLSSYAIYLDRCRI